MSGRGWRLEVRKGNICVVHSQGGEGIWPKVQPVRWSLTVHSQPLGEHGKGSDMERS